MPRVLPRPPTPKPDFLRVLALLASSREGLTERTLLKHGCTAKQISELAERGLATVSVQRIFVAKRTIEVTRVRITHAGLRVKQGEQEKSPEPKDPGL